LGELGRDRFQQVIHGLLIRRYLSAVECSEAEAIGQKIDGQLGQLAASAGASPMQTDPARYQGRQCCPNTHFLNQPTARLAGCPKSPGGGASGSTLGRGTGRDKLPSFGVESQEFLFDTWEIRWRPLCLKLPADQPSGRPRFAHTKVVVQRS